MADHSSAWTSSDHLPSLIFGHVISIRRQLVPAYGYIHAQMTIYPRRAFRNGYFSRSIKVTFEVILILRTKRRPPI